MTKEGSSQESPRQYNDKNPNNRNRFKPVLKQKSYLNSQTGRMKSSNDVTIDQNDGMNFDEFSNQVDTQKQPATLASKEEVINSMDEK